MSGGKDDPESQAQLDRAGSSHYLSILSSFTPEESLTDCDPGNENEYNSSTSEISLCLLDSSAESFATPERPPTSVLTQTDSSWLLSRRLRETAQGEHLDTHEERGGQESASDGTEASEKESDSILEGDLSDSTSKESLEDLIVHTEFIDQLKPGRFGSCLYTLPSIGLPTILAYKYESREKPIDYKALSPKVTEIQLQKVSELDGAEDYWQWTRNRALFCCKQYQELSEFLMEEEELLHLKSQSEVIDISPHLPHSSFVERQQAKEKSALRLHKRTMEKYLKKAKETEHKLSSGSKRHTTITFQLSTSLDVEKLKKPREEEDEWDNIFTEVVDDTFSWHKDLPLSFLVKNYKNGNKFLTTFADGTAQIFYPSGNLAILIFTDKERKITCIVQEDRAADPAIRAVFTSFGRCTCYHPNGVVWVNTNAFGGHYADEQGTRLRRWFWRDPSSPLTFTPFKPLFISLNENIGVRIIEQQRIFLTFLAMGKQAKFNLGSMLKFKTPTMQSITNSWMTEADLLLQTSWLKVQTIINKLCVALNFPSNDPEKIALPLYLVTRQQKLSQLYASIKMEESINMENVA
ncbi:glutamate-rich protein 6 isoform X2 [Pristis pectinata]|uniref:glutamate-rich protein 6 isoform X2 n=1 Tax=Pristis pectinata TaxID=685728 RepID=UPI00223D1291|nr:glutamate-rich protein 6 isoform X2 [Pristis pectinata]